MTVPLVVFHAGCWDGFGAAMVLADAHDGPVELVPGHYGMPIPAVDGREVWIVDFSFPVEQMVHIADRAAQVVWLDHHKTAVDACLDAMAGHPNVAARTAMDRSGIGLAWDWAYAGATAPFAVRYIEDRDLWRKDLPGSDAVAMWIRSHDMTPEAWARIRFGSLEAALTEGGAMLAYHERLVRNAAANAVDVEIDGWRMPLVSCSYDLGSDVCDLLIRERQVPVAAYWLLNKRGEWQYGFRSVEGFDCSAIARRFGGGGHAQAAGCTSPQPIHQPAPERPSPSTASDR